MGWEDPLEEGMATHSTIPAWRIPWTEEPDGLQSTGLHTVGHDLCDLACRHARVPGLRLNIYPFILYLFSFLEQAFLPASLLLCTQSSNPESLGCTKAMVFSGVGCSGRRYRPWLPDLQGDLRRHEEDSRGPSEDRWEDICPADIPGTSLGWTRSL